MKNILISILLLVMVAASIYLFMNYSRNNLIGTGEAALINENNSQVNQVKSEEAVSNFDCGNRYEVQYSFQLEVNPKLHPYLFTISPPPVTSEKNAAITCIFVKSEKFRQILRLNDLNIHSEEDEENMVSSYDVNADGYKDIGFLSSDSNLDGGEGGENWFLFNQQSRKFDYSSQYSGKRYEALDDAGKLYKEAHSTYLKKSYN